MSVRRKSMGRKTMMEAENREPKKKLYSLHFFIDIILIEFSSFHVIFFGRKLLVPSSPICDVWYMLPNVYPFAFVVYFFLWLPYPKRSWIIQKLKWYKPCKPMNIWKRVKFKHLNAKLAIVFKLYKILPLPSVGFLHDKQGCMHRCVL
jgi:hypothetical protein